MGKRRLRQPSSHEEVDLFSTETAADLLKKASALGSSKQSGCPDELETCFDELIPRSGVIPSTIQVSFEDYLSRMLLFSRKIRATQYRFEAWKRESTSQLAKFEGLKNRLIEHREQIPDKATFTHSMWNLNVGSELEAFTYSGCATLSMLAKLVSAFLPGKTQMHSYRDLLKVLRKEPSWAELADVMGSACSKWGEDLFARRDAATHYVALIAISKLGALAGDTEETDVVMLGIPRKPEKYVSIWWEGDVPVKDGTATTSVRWQLDDGRTVEAHAIVDGDGHIIARRNGPLPPLPDLINANEYVEGLMRDLNQHSIDVLRFLGKKVCPAEP